MSLFILLDALPVRALIPYIWEFVPLEERARAATDDWKQSLLNRDTRYWPYIFQHRDVWWWEFKKLLVQNQGRFVVEDTRQQFCFAARYAYDGSMVYSVDGYSLMMTRAIGWKEQRVRVHIVLRGGRVLFHNFAVVLYERSGCACFEVKPLFADNPTFTTPEHVHTLRPQ